ncbi:27517_t:CDS:1, partial [Racocetra persica]
MTSRNLHEEAKHLKNLSYVANTEKNTTKWLHHVDRYRQANNIDKTIDQIDNKAELNEFLSLFIAWLTKINGKPFKVESINNCYAALACYLCKNSFISDKVNIWDKYTFSRTIQ